MLKNNSNYSNFNKYLLIFSKTYFKNNNLTIKFNNKQIKIIKKHRLR